MAIDILINDKRKSDLTALLTQVLHKIHNLVKVQAHR